MRARLSNSVVDVRPSGDFAVSVPPAFPGLAVNVLTLACPSLVTVSTSCSTRSASRIVTVRVIVVVVARPPGVVIVSRAGYGDCRPKRGSGASCCSVAVPSASTTTIVPSGRRSELSVAPPGSTTACRKSPVESSVLR